MRGGILDQLARPYWSARAVVRWAMKVAAYAVFLWDDRDFDEAFILRLLQFKIKRTREHITGHNFIADAPRIARQMRVAESLLNRIQQDSYCEAEWAEHYKKWPHGEGYDFNNKAPEEMEDVRRIAALEAKRTERDFDFLFRHLKKYIRNWWD
jgi:hypothetical protein